jgi:hypothetical protein
MSNTLGMFHVQSNEFLLFLQENNLSSEGMSIVFYLSGQYNWILVCGVGNYF